MKNYYISIFSASLNKFASLNNSLNKSGAVIQALTFFFNASSSLSRIFNVKATDPHSKLSIANRFLCSQKSLRAFGHLVNRYDLKVVKPFQLLDDVEIFSLFIAAIWLSSCTE